MSTAPPPAAASRKGALGSPSRIMRVALFLGWAFDALFYGKALGVSVLLFVLGLLVTLFWVGRLEGVKLAARNLWLVVPLIFFAGMVVLRANDFLTLLNVSTVLVLLGLVVYFYSSGHSTRLGLLEYVGAFMLTGVNLESTKKSGV